MAKSRTAGHVAAGAREVDEARAVVLAVQQTAVDHDLEQLADTRGSGGIRELRADLLYRRALTTVEDVHDLAFAAGQVEALALRHGVSEFFRCRRIYSPSPALSSALCRCF